MRRPDFNNPALAASHLSFVLGTWMVSFDLALTVAL